MRIDLNADEGAVLEGDGRELAELREDLERAIAGEEVESVLLTADGVVPLIVRLRRE